MKKQQIAKVITWSTIALIVPVLGQLFVDGWNWGAGEFAFAWAFFTALGLSYAFVTNKIADRAWSIAAGVAVIAVFATVWIMLATG